MGGSTLMRLDPDGLRYVATILVWAHWFVVAFSFVQLAYRPAGWPERYLLYAPLSLPQRPGEGRYEVASTGPPDRAPASLGARGVSLGIGIGV